jgi:hypothetical protein
MLREGRRDTSLSFLEGLERRQLQLRRAVHPLLRNNWTLATQVKTLLFALFRLLRQALIDSGVPVTDRWFFYASSIVAPPYSQRQDSHQDRGDVPANEYFTLLIPVLFGAQLTEFEIADNEHRTFPGTVLFHGKVWHCGPAVGVRQRTLLALIASKWLNEIHDIHRSLLCCARDWKLVPPISVPPTDSVCNHCIGIPKIVCWINCWRLKKTWRY